MEVAALLSDYITVYTVYTIQTALHCFNTSMHAHIYCKVKMLLEWADKLLSKMWGDGVYGLMTT